MIQSKTTNIMTPRDATIRDLRLPSFQTARKAGAGKNFNAAAVRIRKK
jgi:hypothetical protein